MPRLPQRVKACRALQLADRFEPTVRIKHLIKINLDEAVSCLRTSASEDAQTICANYDRIAEELRTAIDIDDLIYAAGCKDVHKIFGIICESYSRVKAMETQMIAASESPAIMKSASRYAKERTGHAHAKMVLSTTGVLPLPQNQKNIFIGNKIDNSQNTQFNVDRHESVVDDVSDIFKKLPSVSQTENLRKDGGD